MKPSRPWTAALFANSLVGICWQPVPGGGKRNGRKWLENRRAAEQPAALGERGHGGKRVDRILGGIVLVVDEEIGFVAAVVDVRNLQRAADGAAERVRRMLPIFGELRAR